MVCGDYGCIYVHARCTLLGVVPTKPPFRLQLHFSPEPSMALLSCTLIQSGLSQYPPRTPVTALLNTHGSKLDHIILLQAHRPMKPRSCCSTLTPSANDTVWYHGCTTVTLKVQPGHPTIVQQSDGWVD